MTTANSINIVSAKVRAMAAEKRISIRKLSALTGIEYSALLRRTRGEVEFTITDLGLVAEALGCTLSALVPADAEAVAA